MTKLTSQWRYNTETPKEGAKIEYIIGKAVEVDTWENGRLHFRPDDWHYIKYWRYIDENYGEKRTDVQ
jgi:hypothetical protein